jgi:hypothetical protein
MKRFPITVGPPTSNPTKRCHGGEYVCLDDDIEEILRRNNWSVSVFGNGGYTVNGKNKSENLTHYVWRMKGGAPVTGTDNIVHKDRDRRNCQWENLECVSKNLVQADHGKLMASNTSGIQGVSHEVVITKDGTRYDYWRARIREKGKKYRSKSFPFTPSGASSAEEWYDTQFEEIYGRPGPNARRRETVNGGTPAPNQGIRGLVGQTDGAVDTDGSAVNAW